MEGITPTPGHSLSRRALLSGLVPALAVASTSGAWAAAAPGRYTLQARATDRTSHTQPTAHDPDRRTYMVNKIGAVEVVVA